MFIKTPDDAPENYGVITKKVYKAGTSGQVNVPVTWIGGDVCIYHNGEYGELKRVKAMSNSAGIYVHKSLVGSEIAIFLITPPTQ